MILTEKRKDQLQVKARKVCRALGLPLVKIEWKKRRTGTMGLYYKPDRIVVERHLFPSCPLGSEEDTVIHEMGHHYAFHKSGGYKYHGENYREGLRKVNREWN